MTSSYGCTAYTSDSMIFLRFWLKFLGISPYFAQVRVEPFHIPQKTSFACLMVFDSLELV